MFTQFQHKIVDLEKIEGILMFIKQQETWKDAEKYYHMFDNEAFCDFLDKESRDGWIFVSVVRYVKEDCHDSYFHPNPRIPHTILMKRELLANPYRK